MRRYTQGMTLAIIPFIVLVIGLLMYALSSNAKVAEIGRIMFFTGLLVALHVASGWTTHI